MGITYRDLEQAYAQHKAQYGGSKEDYFALLYLTREFEKSPDQVARHIAFGKDVAEGINAFHVDANRRNLYLFQFQFKKQYQAFQEPLRRLAHEGMERIFGPAPEAPGFLLAELRARLQEDPELIDRVLVHFVYNGDPSDAEQSAMLDALREDLDAKKHLVDHCFEGRNIALSFQFISNEARGPRVGSRTHTTHRYELALPEAIESETETGEKLHVGFVGVLDLYKMFREMGPRLFERNIRAGLDPDGPINKKFGRHSPMSSRARPPLPPSSSTTTGSPLRPNSSRSKVSGPTSPSLVCSTAPRRSPASRSLLRATTSRKRLRSMATGWMPSECSPRS